MTWQRAIPPRDRGSAFYTTFSVRGKAPFPFDMLRYDACYPADDASVKALHTQGTLITINLIKIHWCRPHHITASRWATFGWSVLTSTITSRLMRDTITDR